MRKLETLSRVVLLEVEKVKMEEKKAAGSLNTLGLQKLFSYQNWFQSERREFYRIVAHV